MVKLQQEKLDAFSEFGKEFDSFCDAVSFGLAPSMLIYSILISRVPGSPFVVPVSFLCTLCDNEQCKFNIINLHQVKKEISIGMPIPNATNNGCFVYYVL